MTTEVEHLIQSTHDLIVNSPVEVSLVRAPQWERTSAGGVRRQEGEAATLDPVSRYFGRVTDIFQVLTQHGERVEVQHILIGEWWDDIQEGDRFSLWGRDFLVAAVDPDRRYQTKAYVVEQA